MKLLLQQISSTLISELLSKSQFDGVMIDHEHGCFNDESLYSSIQIITSLNKKCFVRLTDFDKRIIRMCLDAGVSGLIFSTIEDVDFAKQIVNYCHYPSSGGTRGQGLVRENDWGKKELGTQKPLLIAQIETKNGIDNIKSLKEVGFDKYLIGPYDLSASLGVPGDFTNPNYISYTEKLQSVIPKENLGIFCVKTQDVITQYPHYQHNFGFFILGMDSTFIQESVTLIEKEVYK